MSLTVKAFFYEDFGRDNPVASEIRRLSIDTDVSSNYAYLTQKLASVLSRGLKANRIATFWRDDEGDFVTFTSDEELVEALGSMTGDMFKVHVHRIESKEPEEKDDYCQAQKQQWGCYRPLHPGWGGFHGGPFWHAQMTGHAHGFRQPRWGRCLSRREERRQQRRQEEEHHGQRDQSEEAGGQRQKCDQQRKGRRHHLKKLGKAVAAALEPFGVEVDVDVNDEDTPVKQEEQPPFESESDQEPSEEHAETTQEESDAAYAAAAQAQEFHDAATHAVATVTGVPTCHPYENVLAKLNEMGFDDDGGWLTHLLHAKGGDIGRVLDAIQPQSRKK